MFARFKLRLISRKLEYAHKNGNFQLKNYTIKNWFTKLASFPPYLTLTNFNMNQLLRDYVLKISIYIIFPQGS
jgi:hypothetical protein